jgi:predicted Zn finger-like uncharacterized protein
MSLATRCTACGTIFRVVQDQLRVSEGWVRCGRCAEVFDAREQLFDIDAGVPPPWPRPAATTAPTAQTEAEPPPQAQLEAQEPIAASSIETRNDEDERLERPAPHAEAETFALSPDADERREPYWGDEATAAAPMPPAVEQPHAAEADHRHQSQPPHDVLIDPRLVALAAQVAEREQSATTPPSEAAAEEPSFLRQHHAAARWQHPRVRLALGLCAGLLLAVLLLQLIWHFRSAIAALYPPSAPALHALCNIAGCELQPWRRIDALAVENSSLTQAGSGNHYKLTVQLRNKAHYALALPWIDLSLSDASGAPVLRRMLKPTDFNLSKTSMSPDGEEQLQLVFSTGTQRVSGYSVEIFHP